MTVRRALIAAALAIAALSCSGDERPPITVAERMVTVENQSSTKWSDVEVWLNDHYRVTTPVLEAGGRFVAPQASFVAGFGQRFDPARQSAYGVLVTARGADGSSVKLVWGKPYKR